MPRMATDTTALVVYGGWDGHMPSEVSTFFAEMLTGMGENVLRSDSLDAFLDLDAMPNLRIIVPVWTMGEMTNEQVKPVLQAVEHRGVGMAGCHGGMCDAFRNCTEWQFLTGGQWVAHPGDDQVEYEVEICGEHEITTGIANFSCKSEQYYLHTDPANQVLATTKFPIAEGPHTTNGNVTMPVVWTKMYGTGRVFYCSLGHRLSDLTVEPVCTIMRRGIDWAMKN